MTDSPLTRILRHAVAVAGFACLSLVFTYPIVLHLKTGVIGAGAGDNMSALWNVWWARKAAFGPDPLFSTPALFAPISTSLALHSYAPLGPYLRVFGYNTAFMLPQTFLRFVPVLANARIPGRAFVLVALMLALIGALALVSIESSLRQRLSIMAVALVIFDFWPAPHAWTFVDRPALYLTLQRLPDGVVLEVPMGIRDGFGERGRLDHMTLYNQTIHGQRMVGGFVARLGPRIKNAYEADPVFRPLLDLSEGKPVEAPSRGCQDSLACAVRYVVINESATPDLVKFVNDTFEMTLVERGDHRTLYEVRQLRGCTCGQR